jgi:ATP-dependent DNA helicase RecG
VQLRVFTDRLEVVSPGGLHFGLTASDLYRPHTSLPWNPMIFGGLYRRGIVDQLGSGTMRMVKLCTEHGLGWPVFSSTPSSVSCTIPRRGYWLSAAGTSILLADQEQKALRIMTTMPTSRGELVERLGLGDTQIRDILGRLRGHGLAHPEGLGRGATWTIGPG